MTDDLGCSGGMWLLPQARWSLPFASLYLQEIEQNQRPYVLPKGVIPE